MPTARNIEHNIHLLREYALYLSLPTARLNVSDDIRAKLSDNALLGRLHFSVTDGLNDAGQVETLYTFGGRSLTVFRSAH